MVQKMRIKGLEMSVVAVAVYEVQAVVVGEIIRGKDVVASSCMDEKSPRRVLRYARPNIEKVRRFNQKSFGAQKAVWRRYFRQCLLVFVM